MKQSPFSSFLSSCLLFDVITQSLFSSFLSVCLLSELMTQSPFSSFLSVCLLFGFLLFDVLKQSVLIQTQGLLGTLDQDAANDFTTPQGDVIPTNANEDTVYLDFSLKCRLRQLVFIIFQSWFYFCAPRFI